MKLLTASRSIALPLDIVLGLLLNQSNTLQDICDIIDPPLLNLSTFIQCVSRYHAQMGECRNKIAPNELAASVTAMSGVTTGLPSQL